VPPYEKVYIRKDGSRVPIIIGLAAIEGQNDKTVSFMLDITEQDKAKKVLKQHTIELQKLNAELEESQEVLRLSEARFRRMFESDLLGIVFWDKEGNFLEVNNLFLYTIGYSREDWLQGRMNWIDITPPEYARIDQDKLVELDATGIISSV
jgi:PAS domain-containing protein